MKFQRKHWKNEETSGLEIDTEIEIGNCLLLMGLSVKVFCHYELASEVAKTMKFHESALKALLKMSECVKDDHTKYEMILNDAISYAKLHLLLDFEADMLVTLGHFKVTQKAYAKALDYFNGALKIYKKTDQGKKLQQVRFLMAPLKGKC